MFRAKRSKFPGNGPFVEYAERSLEYDDRGRVKKKTWKRGGRIGVMTSYPDANVDQIEWTHSEFTSPRVSVIDDCSDEKFFFAGSSRGVLAIVPLASIQSSFSEVKHGREIEKTKIDRLGASLTRHLSV